MRILILTRIRIVLLMLFQIPPQVRIRILILIRSLRPILIQCPKLIRIIVLVLVLLLPLLIMIRIRIITLVLVPVLIQILIRIRILTLLILPKIPTHTNTNTKTNPNTNTNPTPKMLFFRTSICDEVARHRATRMPPHPDGGDRIQGAFVLSPSKLQSRPRSIQGHAANHGPTLLRRVAPDTLRVQLLEVLDRLRRRHLREPLHLRLRELEGEQVPILQHPLRSARLGNVRDALLHEEAARSPCRPPATERTRPMLLLPA